MCAIAGITTLAADCVRRAPVLPIFLGKRNNITTAVTKINAVITNAKTLKKGVAAPKSAAATWTFSDGFG